MFRCGDFVWKTNTVFKFGCFMIYFVSYYNFNEKHILRFVLLLSFFLLLFCAVHKWKIVKKINLHKVSFITSASCAKSDSRMFNIWANVERRQWEIIKKNNLRSLWFPQIFFIKIFVQIIWCIASVGYKFMCFKFINAKQMFRWILTIMRRGRIKFYIQQKWKH